MAPQALLDADANGAGAGGIGNLDHVVVTTIPPADEFNIPVWFDTHLGVRIAPAVIQIVEAEFSSVDLHSGGELLEHLETDR